MSALTAKDIEAIAVLARLSVTEDEKRRYADQLSVVFDSIELLREVVTDGVEETCQVTGLTDVVREDQVNSCDPETKKKLIACFPEKIGALLKVKAVFDDGAV